jgi:hypothetical protein
LKEYTNKDMWEVVYTDVGNVRKGSYKMWYRKPKVFSCLELVRTGDIDPKDAREAFKLWEVDDDEMIEKTLNFVAKLAEHQVGKKKTKETNETDNPELGMIMLLLKGLGLQIPPHNESPTENTEQILEKMFPDEMWKTTTEEDTADEKLEFHEILAVSEGNETENLGATEEDIKGAAEAIEMLFHYDPAAAAELFAPLLQAFEALKNLPNSPEGAEFMPINSTILNAAQGGEEEEEEEEEEEDGIAVDAGVDEVEAIE